MGKKRPPLYKRLKVALEQGISQLEQEAVQQSSNQTSDSFDEQIRQGLEQVRAYARGEIELRTTVITWPDPAPKLSARRIRMIRESLNMPQSAFAAVLNVSPKTVQAWEQGVRKPDGAALRLLQIVAEHPAIMDAVPTMKYSRKVTNEGTPEQRALYGARRRKKVA